MQAFFLLSVHPLLQFSFFLNLFCTILTVWYCYRILHLNISHSLAWSMKLVAMLLQFVQLFFGLAFVVDIDKFISQYPPWVLITSYGMGAIRTVCILLFVAIVYYSLRKIKEQNNTNHVGLYN